MWTIHHLKKFGKVWKLVGWIPTNSLTTLNMSKFATRFETSKLYSLSGNALWLLFKNVKRKKVCVSPSARCVFQKNTEKSTVRRQYGMFDEIEIKSFTRKSSQTKFVISGIMTMSVNSGGFRRKMASLSAISPTETSTDYHINLSI